MAEQSPRMKWTFPSVDDDPWFDGFVDHVRAQDASGFASREDRHTIITEGGSISWDAGTKALTWDAALNLTAPITGFLWQVPPQTKTLSDGEVLSVLLNRGPGQNSSVASNVSSVVPSDNDTIVLAIRIGTTIWWRNGTSMADGETISGIGSGSTDRRTAGIIVGNVPNGDTSPLVDFLDVGDGVLLEAALAAAGPGADIYIRAGVYDLGAGAATAPLVVPAGVKIRGAGRGHTIIRTKDSGTLAALSISGEVEDLTVEVALPVAPAGAAPEVILLGVDRAELRRVNVVFLGLYSPLEAGFLAGLNAAVALAADKETLRAIDVAVRDLPSLELLLGGPATMSCFLVKAGINPKEDQPVLERCIAEAGDFGFQILGPTQIVTPTILSPFVAGIIVISALSERTRIQGGTVLMGPGAAVPDVGVDIGGAARVRILGMTMTHVPGGAGTIGIRLGGSSSGCVLSHNSLAGFDTGISLGASTLKNIVGLNDLIGVATATVDAGANNDVAHNVI